MPEGPEVFKVTEGLQPFVGKTIKSVNILSGRYARDAKHARDLDALRGDDIKRITCKGKLIVFHFETMRGFESYPYAMLSTLGMSGEWSTTKTKHARIEIVFDDAWPLYFNDTRNFGTFKVVTYREMKRKLLELGPDVLVPKQLWAAISLPDFKARVRRFGKTATVAEALLDQRILSGVGNYIRADAMYLGRFSPLRPISELTDSQLNSLWACCAKVANAALMDVHPMNSTMQGYTHLVYGLGHSPSRELVVSYEDKNGRRVWYSPKEQTL